MFFRTRSATHICVYNEKMECSCFANHTKFCTCHISNLLPSPKGGEQVHLSAQPHLHYIIHRTSEHPTLLFDEDWVHHNGGQKPENRFAVIDYYAQIARYCTYVLTRL